VHPRYLRTEPGVGYRLVDESGPPRTPFPPRLIALLAPAVAAIEATRTGSGISSVCDSCVVALYIAPNIAMAMECFPCHIPTASCINKSRAPSLHLSRHDSHGRVGLIPMEYPKSQAHRNQVPDRTVCVHEHLKCGFAQSRATRFAIGTESRAPSGLTTGPLWHGDCFPRRSSALRICARELEHACFPQKLCLGSQLSGAITEDPGHGVPHHSIRRA
jgi:hypothetical protein